MQGWKGSPDTSTFQRQGERESGGETPGAENDEELRWLRGFYSAGSVFPVASRFWVRFPWAGKQGDSAG